MSSNTSHNTNYTPDINAEYNFIYNCIKNNINDWGNDERYIENFKKRPSKEIKTGEFVYTNKTYNDSPVHNSCNEFWDYIAITSINKIHDDERLNKIKLIDMFLKCFILPELSNIIVDYIQPKKFIVVYANGEEIIRVAINPFKNNIINLKNPILLITGYALYSSFQVFIEMDDISYKINYNTRNILINEETYNNNRTFSSENITYIEKINCVVGKFCINKLSVNKC